MKCNNFLQYRIIFDVTKSRGVVSYIYQNTPTSLLGKFYSFDKRAIMANTLKYMIDENGERTSVSDPLKTWEKIHHDYSSFKIK